MSAADGATDDPGKVGTERAVDPGAELLVRFLAGRLVLSADQAAQVREAQQLLHDARRQAAEILAQAHAEAQQLRDAARLDIAQQTHLAREAAGQAARQEVAREVVEKSASQARSLGAMDERIGTVVMRTLGKILSEREAEHAFFASVMQKVLRVAREEKFLSVRVHPEQLNAARKAIDEVIGATGAPGFIDVVPEAGLNRGACLVESEHGIIDASLDTQLEAIRQALTKVWRDDRG